MKRFGRIVLSSIVFSALGLGTGCLDQEQLSDDEQVTGQASALTGIEPCGLWIASTPELANARYLANKTNPDMVQLPLAGGLACSAIIAAVPAVEANWGAGHAVVHYIHAPGVVAAQNEVDLAHPDQADGSGTEIQGIGTSPSINSDTYEP